MVTARHLPLILFAAVQVMVPLASAAAQPTEDKVAGYIAEAAKKFTVLPKCEAGPGGEIVVCGRRSQSERYRLPIRPDGFDKRGPVQSVSRERNALIQEGDSGIGSCSTSGPGGWTGCFHRDVKRGREQHGK